ncbi:alpha/beta hydrolase [Frigidibacter sp. MR17.24]|uniref:alpha/beta hydrolase n=1 Tax=Frigidibacter sp. MR17.24 TaxID=3127345 RepID=UPI003012B148
MLSDPDPDPDPVWSLPAPGELRLTLAARAAGQGVVVRIRPPQGPAPAAGWPSLWLLDGDATFPLTAPGAGLVVAIAFPSGERFDTPRRSEAFTPPPDAETGAPRSGPVHGGAARFRQFLLQVLRPLVAARWPLDPGATVLFGFSYGGLFACDTLLAAPGSFARIWAASPSLWFSDRQLLRRLAAGGTALQTPGAARPEVTITAGCHEQHPPPSTAPERRAHLARRAMLDTTAAFARGLRAAGLPVTLVHAEGADHFAMLAPGVRGAQAAAFAPFSRPDHPL